MLRHRIAFFDYLKNEACQSLVVIAKISGPFDRSRGLDVSSIRLKQSNRQGFLSITFLTGQEHETVATGRKGFVFSDFEQINYRPHKALAIHKFGAHMT